MQILKNIPLAPLTTLRIGGPARFFAEAASEPELLEAVHFARDQRLSLFILGGGSNLVVADQGFSGLVVRLAAWYPPRLNGTLQVAAGTPWDELVQFSVDQGLCGMECLAGIPGSSGAAPVQNIGAYGQEVADTLVSVRALDLHTGNFVTLFQKDCGFGYRASIFNTTQRGRYILTEVSFQLHSTSVPNLFVPNLSAPNLSYPDLQRRFSGQPSPSPRAVAEAVRSIRRTKGMYLIPGEAANPEAGDFRSAGSFFKNPVVPASTLQRIANTLSLPETAIPHWPIADPTPEASDPAGPIPESIARAESQASLSAFGSMRCSPKLKLSAAWLIERAGFPRGFALPPPHDGVALSSRHTLALTNRSGAARCADLLRLRDHIIHGVEQRFGITLHQEPVMLPE